MKFQIDGKSILGDKDIPIEWRLELVEIINKGNFKWESTFCQKCGTDLYENRSVIYGCFCIQCERDHKLKEIIE